MRSIQANASFIIPRLGLMVVLLWVLWFVTHVIQTTWMVLRNQVGGHKAGSIRTNQKVATAFDTVLCTRHQAALYWHCNTMETVTSRAHNIAHSQSAPPFDLSVVQPA